MSWTRAHFAVLVLIVLMACGLARSGRRRIVDSFQILNDTSGMDVYDTRCSIKTTGNNSPTYKFNDLFPLRRKGMDNTECQFVIPSVGLVPNASRCDATNELLRPNQPGARHITFDPIEKNVCVVKGLDKMAVADLQRYENAVMDNVANLRPPVIRARADLARTNTEIGAFTSTLNQMPSAQKCKGVTTKGQALPCTSEMNEIVNAHAFYRSRGNNAHSVVRPLQPCTGVDIDSSWSWHTNCTNNIRPDNRVAQPPSAAPARQPPPPAGPQSCSFNACLEDQCLSNTCISSPNGVFRLCHVGNVGGLVMFRNNNVFKVIAPRMYTTRACMQGDGNFVLHDANQPVWGANGHLFKHIFGGPYRLRVTDSGDAVLEGNRFGAQTPYVRL